MTRASITPLAALVLLTGCSDPLLDPPAMASTSTSASTSALASSAAAGSGTMGSGAWVPPSAGCDIDLDGRGLLLTTTDFSTGALSIVDTQTKTVTADVALGTSDAIPFWHAGLAYIVHRYQFDFIDVLVPGATWNSAGQHNLESPITNAPNPHSIAFGPDGLAYVPLYATASIFILDLSLPPGLSFVGELDLTDFADPDGSPEPSLAVACGDTLLVSLQHLDTDNGFASLGGEELAVFDLETGSPRDLDPDLPGPQGIPLRGGWLKQVRRDPADPSDLTLLGLSTGIERIDLHEGTTSWLVPPAVFAAANLGHALLPVAFDLNQTGTRAYVAAYGPATGSDADCSKNVSDCFDQARLYVIDLDGETPTLEPFAGDYDVVERTLEVVGDELWFGSRRFGSPGLWIFDVRNDPPRLLKGFDQPLNTGLPPYSMTVTTP